MEKRNQNDQKANEFSSSKQLDDIQNNVEDFPDLFEAPSIQNRSNLNPFEAFDDHHKMANSMFGDAFASSSIKLDVPNNDYKFDFGPSLFKEPREFLDDPFNFNLEYEAPENERSYQYQFEMDLEFQLSDTPSYFSWGNKVPEKAYKLVKSMQKDHFQQSIYQNEEPVNRHVEEIKHSVLENDAFHQLGHSFYDNRSSPKSEYSWNSEKLEQLIRCLTKSKGVNKQKIDNDIVARTVEFGQQKIADELNIPYRRYKSILNKVGIKTSAGRKVKNLKLETQLVEWSLKIKESNKLLTRKMIKDQASKIIKELILSGDTSLKKIRLSKGWLDKFVRRHPTLAKYITSQKGKKGQ